MRDRLIELLSNVPTDYAGNRGIGVVADYLLENGVVSLPVNIGETVYYIFGDSSILELKVASIEIAQIKTFSFVFYCYGGVSFYERDIGKTIFFTREEAERALKGGATDNNVGSKTKKGGE